MNIKNLLFIFLYLSIINLCNAQLSNTKWAYIPEHKNANAAVHNINAQAVDAAGNIYTLGQINWYGFDMNPSLKNQDTNYNKEGENYYFSKVSNTGELKFIHYFHSANNSFILVDAKQILIDKNQDVIIIVDIFGKYDFNFGPDSLMLESKLPTYPDMAVAKYDTNGNLKWAFSIASGTTTGSLYRHAKINSKNDIVINSLLLGNTDLDPSANEVIVNGKGQGLVTYDQDGKYKSHVASQVQFKYATFGTSLALDANDNSYAASFGYYATLISKTDKNGTNIWSGIMGANVYPYADRCDVTNLYHNKNGLLMIGTFLNLIDFDLSTGVDTVRSSNANDMDAFFVNLNDDGTVKWKKIIPNVIKFEKGIIDDSGNLHITGLITGSINWNNLVIGSNASQTAFYAKISNDGELLIVDNMPIGCTLKGICSNDFSQFVINGIITQNNIDIDPTDSIYMLSCLGSGGFTAVYGEKKVQNTDVIKLEKLNLEIYPNPTTRFVNISLTNSSQKLKASIYAIDGKLLAEKEISLQESQLDLYEFPSGFYLIKLKANGIEETQKLFLEK